MSGDESHLLTDDVNALLIRSRESSPANGKERSNRSNVWNYATKFNKNVIKDGIAVNQTHYRCQ